MKKEIMSWCGHIVYEENGEIYYEAWGASTKHPDRVESMENWNVSPLLDIKTEKGYAMNVWQWLMYVASDTICPFRAYGIVEMANNYIYKYFTEEQMKMLSLA